LFAQADSLLKGDITNINAILGIGIWSYECKGTVWYHKAGFFTLSILGWFITALAISLGAPFWFDLLNKFMKLRSSIAIATNENNSHTSTSSVKQISINAKG
jgi:hypothetical protein